MAGEVEVRSLLLKVDASVELLRKNLSDAGTQLDTFTKKGEGAATRFDASMKRINASSGQMRAGFQQLSFQLSDVATQLGSGTSALQVFSQQSGQVIQSIGLMTAGSRGFIGFLGGPWGLVLTSAVTLLISFGSKMLDAADASKLAEAGADSLGKAQGVLGGIFDLTSGKIKSQNELLLANARLMASNLRSEALAARTQAGAVITRSTNQIGGVGSTALLARTFGLPLSVPTGVTKLLQDVQSGALKPEEALRFADTFDLRGSGVDRNTLRQTIIDFATADDKERVAGLIDQTLRTGKLSSEFRQPGRTKKPRKVQEKADPFASIVQDAYDAVNGIRFDTLDPDKASADASRKFYNSLGLNPNQDLKNIFEEIDKRKNAEYEANKQIAEDELQKRTDNIRTLSGLYVDLFQGGTKAIFRDFKQIGLQVIAELLAKFTIAKIAGKSFDLGSALSSSLTAAGFGGFFAAGGNPPVGKASIVGERGPELFIPKVPGTIIPNGRSIGGGSVSVTINAPGATAETVSMIRREIAQVAPAIIQASQKTTVSALQRPRL